MKILFLVLTCKTYNQSKIYIERPDLTRKLSCLETWVPRAINLGHDVIFSSGGNESDQYDEQRLHLYLTLDDSYDYGENISPQYERLKKTIEWCLNNKSFDHICFVTDSDYVNVFCLNEQVYENLKKFDFISSSSGGDGFFLSKKACEVLVYEPHENRSKYCDIALHSRFFNTEIGQQKNLKLGDLSSVKLQSRKNYILGEEYFVTHYCNGKRMYWADFVISNYYLRKPVARKVVYNLPIDVMKEEAVHTYDTTTGNKTPLFYSFYSDQNGWEYFGAHPRSSSIYNYSFSKNSLWKIVFVDFDFFGFKDNKLEGLLINQILESIQKSGYVIFYFEMNCEYNNILIEVLNRNKIAFTLEENLFIYADLDFSVIEEMKSKGYSFDQKFLKISNG